MSDGSQLLDADGFTILDADGKFDICDACCSVTAVLAWMPRVLKDVDGYPALLYMAVANGGDNDYDSAFFRRALDVDGITWDTPIEIWHDYSLSGENIGAQYFDVDAMKQLGAGATVPYAVAVHTAYYQGWTGDQDAIFSVAVADPPTAFNDDLYSSVVGDLANNAGGVVLLPDGFPGLFLLGESGVGYVNDKFFIGDDEDGSTFTSTAIASVWGTTPYRLKIIDGKPAVQYGFTFARCQFADGSDWSTATATLIYVPVDWPGDNFPVYDMIEYLSLPCFVGIYVDAAHPTDSACGFFIADDVDGSSFTAVVIPVWDADTETRRNQGYGNSEEAMCVGLTGSTLTARWSLTYGVPVYGAEICEPDGMGGEYCYFPIDHYRYVVWESTSADGVTWSTPVNVIEVSGSTTFEADRITAGARVFHNFYCDGGDNWVCGCNCTDMMAFAEDDRIVYYNATVVPA